MDGSRFVLPAAQAVARGDVVEPPDDLSAAERACWLALAPLAISERTLTASNIPGFRELCTRWVYCDTFDKRIWHLGGPAMHEADPLVKRLEKWRALLGNSLKEFKLTAFGKPATSDKPKAAANPWGEVAAK